MHQLTAKCRHQHFFSIFNIQVFHSLHTYYLRYLNSRETSPLSHKWDTETASCRPGRLFHCWRWWQQQDVVFGRSSRTSRQRWRNTVKWQQRVPARMTVHHQVTLVARSHWLTSVTLATASPLKPTQQLTLNSRTICQEFANFAWPSVLKVGVRIPLSQNKSINELLLRSLQWARMFQWGWRCVVCHVA